MHTTTIGIRRIEMQSTVLQNEKKQIPSKYGALKVKVVKIGENIRCYPEYETIVQLCKKEGFSFTDAYNEVSAICKNYSSINN